MHARHLTLVVVLAGLIGLAATPALRAADQAANPSLAPEPGENVLPAPDNGSDDGALPLPQLPGSGATEGRTLILIPDTNDDGDADSSSGTLLIIIPRRAPGLQAPDAAPDQPDAMPEPLPGRRVSHTIEA